MRIITDSPTLYSAEEGKKIKYWNNVEYYEEEKEYMWITSFEITKKTVQK